MRAALFVVVLSVLVPFGAVAALTLYKMAEVLSALQAAL
jgi:hypothetical protein